MEDQRSHASPISLPRGGRWVTILIVSVGLIGIAAFSFLKISSRPRFRLRGCFQNVEGLRSGATVRLAGVDVGNVREVRAQPTDPVCPAAVELELGRELRLPDDSVVSVETEGVLGPSYLEIDVTRATGPAIRDGGVFPSKASAKFNAETLNQALTKAVERITQRLDGDKNRRGESGEASPTAPSSKPPTEPATK